LSIGYCFRKIVFNISEVIGSFFLTGFDNYISYLVQREVSTSVLYSAYYGIKCEHDLNVFISIFSEQFIKLILEGSVRTLSKPVQKKEPITSDILKTILRKQYQIDNLQKLRICCLLLLGYAGFLRFNKSKIF
jgi:hypothetical protein